MLGLERYGKLMELDTIDSLSVSTGDVRLMVKQSNQPGIYLRFCASDCFTVTVNDSHEMTITQKTSVWKKRSQQGKLSISWLWTTPSLVVALPAFKPLHILNVEASSGAAYVEDVEVDTFRCSVTGGSLRMQHVSCVNAAISSVSSSIVSRSLRVRERCKLSASSARIALHDSFTPSAGYHVVSNNGSVALGAERLTGTVTRDRQGSPFYSIVGNASRLELR